MWVEPNLIIPDKNMLCVGNRSCDFGTSAGRRKSLGSEVSQGTPGIPRYNQATTVRPLLLTKTILPCIKFLNDGLTPVDHLGLTMRNGWPMTGHYSLADSDLRLGGNGPLVVCCTIHS